MLETAVLERVCTKCKVTKPLTDFYKQPHGKYGRRAECTGCTARRTSDYRERFPEKMKQWSREGARRQMGCPIPTRPIADFCEICGGTEKLHLDHDHDDGKFRGWICNKCNLGLGLLGDSIPCVNRVMEYLLKAEEDDVVGN